jgi:ribosome assembly protein 1
LTELTPRDMAQALASLDACTSSTIGSAEGEGGGRAPAPHEQETFLALGRVFSGTLHSHSTLATLFALGHHHDPYKYKLQCGGSSTPLVDSIKRITTPENLGLYLCLGPSVHPVDSVPAGNIVAIFGLHNYILKSGTLCSTPYCHPMSGITFQSKPMLRVAVEPLQHHNLSLLERGLQKLYQYDPVVEV